jgi:cardiolipin synthase
VLGVDMYFFDNGKEAFDYLNNYIITQAKETIEIQLFIWRDDAIGRKIADSILEAANRGVKVNIYKDSLGAIFELAEENKKSLFHDSLSLDMKIKSYLMDMFYPMKGKNKFWSLGNDDYINKFKTHCNINLYNDKVLNNHSKYLIVDNEILIISGMNFEQKEYSKDLLSRKYYDFMVVEKSKDLVSRFKESNDDNRLNLKEPSMSINFYKNDRNSFNIKEGYINCIEQSEKQIDLVMAYLDNNEIIDILIKKCKSGIVLNIYVPQRSNIQKDLNLKVLKKIFVSTSGKVNIFLCKEMIHGKFIMIDNSYVNFGSANLNNAGLNLMFETNIGFFSDNHKLTNLINNVLYKIKADSILVKRPSFKYNPLRAFVEYIFTS